MKNKNVYMQRMLKSQFRTQALNNPGCLKTVKKTSNFMARYEFV